MIEIKYKMGKAFRAGNFGNLNEYIKKNAHLYARQEILTMLSLYLYDNKEILSDMDMMANQLLDEELSRRNQSIHHSNKRLKFEKPVIRYNGSRGYIVTMEFQKNTALYYHSEIHRRGLSGKGLEEWVEDRGFSYKIKKNKKGIKKLVPATPKEIAYLIQRNSNEEYRTSLIKKKSIFMPVNLDTEHPFWEDGERYRKTPLMATLPILTDILFGSLEAFASWHFATKGIAPRRVTFRHVRRRKRK